MTNLPLTFREQAAIAAMQSLIEAGIYQEKNHKDIAQKAADLADCLDAAIKQHYCNCCMTEVTATFYNTMLTCNTCGSTNLQPLSKFSEEVCKLADPRSAEEIEEAISALQALII